jgi:hypothetical protein
MLDLHSTGEMLDAYRTNISETSRPLTRFERLCLGHTIDSGRTREFSRAELRIAEINRLIEHRHGGEIPENDDPFDGFTVVVAFTVRAEFHDEAARKRFLMTWVSRAKPWIADRSSHVDQLLTKMHPSGKHLKDRTAGEMVNLKAAERSSLRIRTMSPADMTPLQFAKARREAKRIADRERAARKRLEQGAKPQELSLAKTRPWEVAGCSKATWYRRQKQNETVSSHACVVSEIAGETNSSPLISLRIGRDETVSRIPNAPPLEPSISDIESCPDGGASPPDEGTRSNPVTYAAIKNGDVPFGAPAGSLGLPAAVEPPVKSERKRRAVR